jgi:hypothetical protein
VASVGGEGDGLRFILNQLVSQQESENGAKKLAIFSLRYLIEQGILGVQCITMYNTDDNPKISAP